MQDLQRRPSHPECVPMNVLCMVTITVPPCSDLTHDEIVRIKQNCITIILLKGVFHIVTMVNLQDSSAFRF